MDIETFEHFLRISVVGRITDFCDVSIRYSTFCKTHWMSSVFKLLCTKPLELIEIWMIYLHRIQVVDSCDFELHKVFMLLACIIVGVSNKLNLC